MALFVGLSLTLTACDDKNEPDEVIQETLKSATIIQYTIKGRFMSR